MFFSCPHCRELVATDRETRQPPALCPRCGGVLQEPQTDQAASPAGPDHGPSFASFLRAGDTLPIASIAPAFLATADDVEPLNRARAGSEQVIRPADETESIATAGPAGEALVVEVEPQPAPLVAPRAIPQAMPLAAGQPPSFTRVSTTATPAHAAKWQWAAVFVLATVLLLQVLVADRARLASDANWRPILTTLCSVLRCSLPAWHQPGAIAMLSRDVSPIPGSNGGLEVRATFRNDARWSQPWPVLLLSLSDADGRVLGSRAFLPGEYLGADATQTELAPGQSARITLKLREPNPDVVAFSFDFR